MKENILKIGLALNHIATALDKESFEKVKPYLNTIEENVMALAGIDAEEGKKNECD